MEELEEEGHLFGIPRFEHGVGDSVCIARSVAERQAIECPRHVFVALISWCARTQPRKDTNQSLNRNAVTVSFANLGYPSYGLGHQFHGALLKPSLLADGVCLHLGAATLLSLNNGPLLISEIDFRVFVAHSCLPTNEISNGGCGAFTNAPIVVMLVLHPIFGCVGVGNLRVAFTLIGDGFYMRKFQFFDVICRVFKQSRRVIHRLAIISADVLPEIGDNIALKILLALPGHSSFLVFVNETIITKPLALAAHLGLVPFAAMLFDVIGPKNQSVSFENWNLCRVLVELATATCTDANFERILAAISAGGFQGCVVSGVVRSPPSFVLIGPYEVFAHSAFLTVTESGRVMLRPRALLVDFDNQTHAITTYTALQETKPTCAHVKSRRIHATCQPNKADWNTR